MYRDLPTPTKATQRSASKATYKKGSDIRVSKKGTAIWEVTHPKTKVLWVVRSVAAMKALVLDFLGK